jgi:hypothetical protein
MNETGEKKDGFFQRLKEEYRLVVFTSDTFQEVRSFDLSLRSIYGFISMACLILLIVFYGLFALTPLKNLIPGYGKIEANADFIKLIEKIDDIDGELQAQDTYLSAMRTMLTIPDIAQMPNYKQIKTPINNKVTKAKKVQSTQQDKSIKNDIPINHSIYDTWLSAEVILPVQGIVSSKFTPEIKHYGVDILAPESSPINAIMDGYVFSSGWDLETGYTIGVQHEGNVLSFYKHNSILLKEKGTFVQAGEAIAIIGNTGTLSSGPHLHFELWHSGKPLNPEDFLNF